VVNVDDLLAGLIAVEGFNERLRSVGLQFTIEPLDKGAAEDENTLEVAGRVVARLQTQRGESPLDSETLDNLIGLVREQTQAELMLRYELQNTLEELISKYEELTVLYESAETVATVMNLEEVCQLILEQAAEILDVAHGSLMLLNDEGDTLEVVAAKGLREDTVGKVTVPVGEEISGRVAQTGKPILIEDLSDHPEFSRPPRAEEDWTSLISVPLRVRDRIL
jgi:transcriptional regulator with GAF, ATPase, and Fis domain